MSRIANLQRQRDQWVKGLNQEVEINDNERGVSVWGDKKVLEMDSGDIPITLWMCLMLPNYQILHLKMITIVYMYLITKSTKINVVIIACS